VAHEVQLLFDFVSPYSWLALLQARAFAREHDLCWQVRPVVYAALLDASGLVGPAESPAKRRYTFRDVQRCAQRLGVALEGPPAHPFRSIEALRTICLFEDHPRALALAVRLADACWGEGRDLTDVAELARLVAELDLESDRLARRIATAEVKAALRRNTEWAVELGVFGVPTFVHHGELFWGHDRLVHLADHLAGRGPRDSGGVQRALSRPRGADRKRRPRVDRGDGA